MKLVIFGARPGAGQFDCKNWVTVGRRAAVKLDRCCSRNANAVPGREGSTVVDADDIVSAGAFGQRCIIDADTADNYSVIYQLSAVQLKRTCASDFERSAG